MKRIALFASVLTLLSGSVFAQNIPVDAKVLETLQARIAALESRVRDLESTTPESAKSTPTAKVETKSQPTAPAPVKTAATSPGRPYTIQEGDTVSEIARKHGIPRTAFMESNNIREGEQIYIGDQVVIPSPPQSGSPSDTATQVAQKSNAVPSNQTTYTIKYGDTLSSIARTHNVSVDAIKTANKMTSDQISGGQKLVIPGKGSNTVASNTSTAPTPSKPDAKKSAGDAAAPPVGKTELLRQEETYGLYTIESGDTLFSLARDFFTSQEELQRLNEMAGSIVLRPGKDMVVPTSKYFEHHKLAGS